MLRIGKALSRSFMVLFLMGKHGSLIDRVSMNCIIECTTTSLHCWLLTILRVNFLWNERLHHALVN